MPVHLVDGTFELFRCFHGAPRAQDADGNEVGAVRGLVATLASLIYRHGAVELAVAFDGMAPPRGTVSGDAGALRSQGLLAQDAVRALGVEIWPMTRYQADDALASGAALLRDRCEVVICTSDKDLLQCVRGTAVVVWDRIRDVRTDQAGLRARFGVDPEQVPDLFALVGDPSDGLPGVPGWGWKSAAAVLGRHRTIEAIPSEPDAWEVKVRGAASLARSLGARRREAILGRDLSRLREDLPVPVEALRWRGPTPELGVLLQRLGDPELAAWVPDRLTRALERVGD